MSNLVMKVVNRLRNMSLFDYVNSIFVIVMSLPFFLFSYWTVENIVAPPPIRQIEFVDFGGPTIIRTTDNIQFIMNFTQDLSRGCKFDIMRYVHPLDSPNVKIIATVQNNSITNLGSNIYQVRVSADIPDKLVPGVYYYQSTFRHWCNPLHYVFNNYYTIQSPKVFFEIIS